MDPCGVVDTDRNDSLLRVIFCVKRRGVLDCPNFGCFVSSRCQHFHCIAMRNSIKVGVNWHKIQEIEHNPGKPLFVIKKGESSTFP